MPTRFIPTPCQRATGLSACHSLDADGQLAVTVRKGRGVDLLELYRAAHHACLPGVVFGILLKLRHHFPGEQLERFADVLMAVFAGLVEQYDLIDVRGAKPP